ncbi:MAG: hypothetical protein HY795_17695 [Desulfovibrio sp.]|nr:hypothetical protein [Desulfovibrio sp.]MBI4960778.1 hypothetical protein [Desulfovibrio sp.]
MFRFAVTALLAVSLLAFGSAHAQDDSAQKALDALDKALDKAAQPAPKTPAAQSLPAGKQAQPRQQDKSSAASPGTKGKRELRMESGHIDRAIQKPGNASAFRDYGAKLDYFSFFESGKTYPPREERLYQNSFVLNSTRFVNWQIGFNFQYTFDAPYSFKLRAVWTFPSGKTEEQEREFNIKPNKENLSLAWGKGYEEPGKLQKGNYKVDIYIEGELVAAGQFIIF